MFNFYLGSNQKEVVIKFLEGKIDINTFKQNLQQWKSNANNALAHITNPIFYGIEFTDKPCEYFANLPSDEFYDYYLFSRMMFFSLYNFEEKINYTNLYKDNFGETKSEYKNEQKVVADFIEGKIAFEEYEKQIKTFKGYKKFLSKSNFLMLLEEKQSYNLNDFEVDNFEDVYNYHFCLYNFAIKQGIKVLPSLEFFSASSLIDSLTVNYEIEYPELAKELKKYLYKNLNLTQKSEENIELTQNLINEYLPKRPADNNDYLDFIQKIKWPFDKNLERFFDLEQVLRKDEKLFFKFVHPSTKKELIINVIDKEYIKNQNMQISWKEGLVFIKEFVLGEKKHYNKVVNTLRNSPVSFFEYEKDYYKNPFLRVKLYELKNCARHRLQLAEFCQKVLKKEGENLTVNEIYHNDFLQERKQKINFQEFLDYFEGYLQVEDFVKFAKQSVEFKDVYKSTNNKYYGNIIDKPVFHKTLAYILKKTNFNAYDRYFLANSVETFLNLKGVEHYNNFEYYNAYKKLAKYGLNYVLDSQMFDFINEILRNKPESLSKEADVAKYCKEKLKDIYTYEKHFPLWSAAPEWQYDKQNEPLHYIGSKVQTQYTCHVKFTFKNKQTDELTEVEQGADEY
jgi:hypothetical protein